MGRAIKNQNNPAPARFRRDAKADPAIGPALGEALRAHYEALVAAPVPERFTRLLDELEAKTPPGRTAPSAPPAIGTGSD